MDKEAKSIRALLEFINELKLRNRVGNVNFKALVLFEMEDHTKEMEMDISISKRDGIRDGVVRLNDPDIDDRSYPTECQAKFQEYNFVEHRFLQIRGLHPRYGKYQTTVTPL